MSKQNVNVPAIRAISHDSMCYIQDNAGSTSLYDLIKLEGFTPHVITLCHKAIEQLVKFQTVDISNIDLSLCYPVGQMAGISVSWDLNYFKYCFLRISLTEIDEVALQKDFDSINHSISALEPQLLIHRDFQSRNIMVKDGETRLIDFQGARRGPALYDIVSFLWQARAGFNDRLRTQLLDYYLQLLSSTTGHPADKIVHGLNVVIIFRMLQVLGAYGFRGLIQKKPAFIQPIHQALDILSQYLEYSDLAYLRHICSQLKKRLCNNATTPSPNNKSLTVDVASFSYKKGIPSDNSGNGGGYVFDCRAIHNPGRYEQYRLLTGNDPEVIKFLEDDGEILKFLENCCALVDQTVERYLKRGFTHLSVNFGCTGGQHRSVYSANFMARHLAEKYGVNVHLNHREQNISECL